MRLKNNYDTKIVIVMICSIGVILLSMVSYQKNIYNEIDSITESTLNELSLQQQTILNKEFSTNVDLMNTLVDTLIMEPSIQENRIINYLKILEKTLN